MFKSSGRRLSQLPSCIARCYGNRDGESRGKKLLAFPWSSQAIYCVSLTSRATICFRYIRSIIIEQKLVHDDDDNPDDTFQRVAKIDWHRYWHRRKRAQCDYNAAAAAAVFVVAVLLNRLALRPAEKYHLLMRMCGCECGYVGFLDISFFSLRKNGTSSTLMMVASRSHYRHLLEHKSPSTCRSAFL